MSVNIIAASFRSIWDDDILKITTRGVLNQIAVEALQFTPSPLFTKRWVLIRMWDLILICFYGLKIGETYLSLFPSFLKKMLQFFPSSIGIPLCISRPNLIEPINNKSSSSVSYFSSIRIHFYSYTFI